MWLKGRSPWIFLLLALGLTVVVSCVIHPDDDSATHDAGIGDTCEDDEDCRRLLTCDGNRTCQPRGTAVEDGYCEMTADCVDGLYCSYSRACTAEGESDIGGGCQTTADCQAGIICVIEGLAGRCREAGDGDIGAECQGPTDCLPGLACPPNPTGAQSCSTPSRSSAIEPPPQMPVWLGETCEEDDGVPRAYFEVPRDGEPPHDFYRLPFPNDIRRINGRIDMTGHPHPEMLVEYDIIGQYLELLETDVDGFARNPVVFFRFSAPQDYETITDAMMLVNITEGSEEYGLEHGFGWYASHGQGSRYICQNWVGISSTSGRPLRAGQTYAMIMRDTLVPVDDSSYLRSDELSALLLDAPPGDVGLTTAWEAYGPLRSWLAADAEIGAADILNAAVFTTQRSDDLVPALREVIRGREAPLATNMVRCDEGVTSPCDDLTVGRGCVAANDAFHEIHGRLEIPIFQQGTPPYEFPEDGGGIEVDADGVPIVARTEEVCFAMTIPQAPPPEAGYPVVIYGHGTGGNFRNGVVSGVAEPLATAESVPIVTISIDFPQHGDRRGDTDLTSDVLFFNFTNPRAARDNVVQGAADLMSLIYWLESANLMAADSPTGEPIPFDVSRIGLFGHSQGATHAALMIPFEPLLFAVVLSGEGGHLTVSLLSKTEPVDIAGILPWALLDADANGQLAGDREHPALAIFQTFFEVSDPVNYALLLRPERDGLRPMRHLFMTYGLGDSYSTELTQRAFARAARLTMIEPVLTENDDGDPDPFGLETVAPPLAGNISAFDADWTVGLRQYQPDEGDDGHYVSTRTAMGAADTIRFLSQALSGQVPQIGQ